MKKAICKLESESFYGQSRFHQVPEKHKESKSDYEDRTWKEKAHWNESGEMFIPGTQFAVSLREAAKFLNIQIPGKGKSTFTKHFEAGIIVPVDYPIGYTRESVEKITAHVPSDGRVGGGKRVTKHFPIVPKWSAAVTYLILDDTITEPVFRQVLKASGELIGIGYWRPRNRGMYGRFSVKNIEWIED